jgi:hypothetical protein
MRNLCPVGSTMALVLLGLGGALLVHPAGAATPCTNLPPSTLQVYVIKASTPEPVAVPAEELDRAAQAEHLVSRHTLMLTSSDFVAWSDVAHRMVSRADGSVCDAPTLVRIGFGSSRRFAFLARAAVADVCVRQEMLDHEAAHSRALVDVVDRFIRQQQSMLERGMATLKQTPAPSDGIAKERWERDCVPLLPQPRSNFSRNSDPRLPVLMNLPRSMPLRTPAAERSGSSSDAAAPYSAVARRRSALPITETVLSTIARAAMTRLSSKPKAG